MMNQAVPLTSGLIIDGQLRTSASGGTGGHVNPATGKVQQTFPCAGAAEVNDAVAAARAAFASWRAWSPERRRLALRELSRLIQRDAEEFVVINALETGTPVSQQRPRLGDIANRFEYFAGWIDKLTGDTIPHSPGRVLDFTLLEPIGVVAKILTWNTPLGGIGLGVAPALAAGCTVVIKPPELAPFAAVKFGRLCQEAGIPDGVVNVIPGGAEAGEALVSHPDIDKISFTGGPETAARIQAGAARALTPLVLELGGKSASLVFPDADLDRLCAFTSLITSINGQGCTLPTRLLVDDAVYDEAVGRIVEALGRVRVGDPLDDDTGMGPVITEAACDRILGMVGRARADGASVLLGGKRLGGELSDGYFVPPTVLGDVDPGSEIAQHEVFGPVIAVTRFSTEEEAVAIANGTVYGLAAYVHTRDIDRALRLASSLVAGNIGVNGAGAPASFAAPFGGVKDSGYGREGGREGIMEFVNVKNVAISLG